MDYKLAVFIGRFQPVHNSHIEVIRQGLSIADKVLIIIGSSYSAPNVKNPFTAEERKMLIQISLTPEEQKRVSFEFVRDYFYNENTWISDIQQCAKNHYQEGDPVVLIGSYKDSSSYYLKLFPQFDFVAAKNTKQLNSTDIRNQLFGENVAVQVGWVDNERNAYSLINKITDISENVEKWLVNEFIGSQRHRNLIQEFTQLAGYRKQWANSPYPPTFVTADAVVIQSGHVLVVKRKFSPGKGLLALPGGFLKQNETIESGAIRELKEETGIRVHKEQLKSKIVDSRVFDFPDRSLRGRTITHAYLIKLDNGELAEVKANDDAESVKWIPLMSLGQLENQFFEDHFHIINFFVNRS